VSEDGCVIDTVAVKESGEKIGDVNGDGDRTGGIYRSDVGLTYKKC